MSEMLVATRTFMTMLDGRRVKVIKGKTRVSADHDLVQGRESMFKPADTTFADVEDTTARPGARRGASKSTDTPGKRAAKKAAPTKATPEPEPSTEQQPAAAAQGDDASSAAEPSTGEGS